MKEYMNKLLKKRKILAFVVFLILAGGWYFFSKKTDEYEFIYPSYESITSYVTETGNVEATGAIPIYSDSDGMVTDIYVQNGKTVKRGEKLFSVTSIATELEKQTAWSNYLAAKTALESAKAAQYQLQATMFDKWDAYRAKYDDDEFDEETDPKRIEPEFQVPQKEWLSAEANYKNQLKIVSQKQADVQAKWLAYQKTQDTIKKAPIAGVIENLAVQKGMMVQAPSALASYQPILFIKTDAVPEVKVKINETDYPQIKLDQKVNILVDAIPNKTFHGSVVRLDTIGTNIQGVITYNVYISIDDPDGIFPGMTVTVSIETEKKDNVLTIDSNAVKPYQGGYAVRILGKNNTVEYIPVQIGIREKNKTEIIKGIDKDTKVIRVIKGEKKETRNRGFLGG